MLEQEVRYIKGIGEKRAATLQKLNINTLGDLISYFPRNYEDREFVNTIRASAENEVTQICATIVSEPRLQRAPGRPPFVRLRAMDDSGVVDITFFNMSYVKNQLRSGETYIFRGRMSFFGSSKQMVNPYFEAPNAKILVGKIVPIYRLTEGISHKFMIQCIEAALIKIDSDMQIPDIVPRSVAEAENLSQARFSYKNIHFPSSFEKLELARNRLIFEELFVLACALGHLRRRKRMDKGIVLESCDIEEFYASLPFSPTGAQRRAVGEALTDMRSGASMNRLLQGDVGSGKTLVAAALMWCVWKSGCQSAFMAPTDILARQHYSTLIGFLEPFGMRVGLLTGSMTAKQRREMEGHLSLGEVDVVVGTHALISENVEFRALALAIADEQHRFGVRQRAALGDKAENPHVLLMSATPIPRTLAFIIYGDLDVSLLDELPPGRQPVDTFAVDERYRERIYRFIEKLVSEGRQAFVVCPMIEESEELPPDMKSAEAYAKQLQEEIYPNLRVGCIHGKMKQSRRDAVMGEFVAGKIDILVSTTVIEVGVDVPNAALMLIENAERFGLSQLHQLRGRVGRGEHKSYCVLMSSHRGEDSQARMQTMCKTSDGFKIAEEDLKMRGPGDFFGSRQHGLPQLLVADLLGDMPMLRRTQDAAERLLAENPNLQGDECAALRERIGGMFRETGDILN